MPRRVEFITSIASERFIFILLLIFALFAFLIIMGEGVFFESSYMGSLISFALFLALAAIISSIWVIRSLLILYRSDSIKIDVGDSKYHRGEVIKGTVNLSLKKPEIAKSLKVSLRCDKPGFLTSSSLKPKLGRFMVCDEVVLGKQQRYSGTCEYDFELKVPTNVIEPLKTQPFYIYAELEFPFSSGLSVFKKIKISKIN